MAPDRSPVLRVLLLSEDTAKGTFELWKKLLHATLPLIDPAVARDRINWAELPPGASLALRANGWKELRHRKDLARQIAREVTATDLPTIVIHHVDGDRRWSDRKRSENATKWRADLFPMVVKAIELLPGLSPDPDAAHNLVAFIPYYSVESWLLQTPGTLARLGIQLPAETTDIEEVEQPKEHLPKNLDQAELLVDLAKAFSAEAVAARGQSYAAAVDALRQAPRLLPALAQAR